MREHPAPGDDEPRSMPTHYQHCLYLLAEAERMVDRAAAAWSTAETGLVKSRLKQIAAKLQRSSTPT
jgi:hypothetical protein